MPQNCHIKFLSVLLISVLCLQGCASRTSTPSDTSSASQSSSQTRDSMDSEADSLRFYPYDQLLPARQWTSDGHLVIQKDNTLTWLDSENQVVKSVEIPMPDMYEKQTLTVFHDNVFAAFAMNRDDISEGYLHPMTRAIKQDDKYTLVNCALYTADGQLLKKFPTVSEDMLAMEYMPFEKTFPQCNIQSVYWLDDTHFVVEDTARIFLYDLESETLTLVRDYTQEKNMGYTIGDSGSYGVREQYTDNGKFYFRAASNVTSTEQPRLQFYEMDIEGNIKEISLFADIDSVKVENGVISLYKSVAAPDGANSLEAWYLTEGSSEPVGIGVYDQMYLTQLLHDNDRISYMETRMEIKEMEDGTTRTVPSLIQFHSIDRLSGENTSFDPTVYDYGDLPAPSEDGYFYALLGTREKADTIQFIYALAWEEQLGVNEFQRHSRLYLYDTKTDVAHLIDQTQDLSAFSVNPSLTAAAEEVDYSQVHLIPLDIY